MDGATGEIEGLHPVSLLKGDFRSAAEAGILNICSPAQVLSLRLALARLLLLLSLSLGALGSIRTDLVGLRLLGEQRKPNGERNKSGNFEQ